MWITRAKLIFTMRHHFFRMESLAERQRLGRLQPAFFLRCNTGAGLKVTAGDNFSMMKLFLDFIDELCNEALIIGISISKMCVDEIETLFFREGGINY